MPRDRSEKQNVSWEDRYGTTASGNLSQYKVGDNLCNIDINNITYPDVVASDFRTYHKKCPYSTESLINWTKDSGDLTQGELASHIYTNGIMIREYRGSKRGFLCVDDNCPYYTTVSSGNRYFYI